MGRKRRQERRDEKKEDRQLGTHRSSATRYQMRQKLVAVGDDFYIENDQGQKAFKVEVSQDHVDFQDRQLERSKRLIRMHEERGRSDDQVL